MSEIRTIAEIEAENSRLENMYATQRYYDRKYLDQSIDVGYSIDAATAREMIKIFDPSKINIPCVDYTIVLDSVGAAIVGRDEEKKGLFTVVLPREVPEEIEVNREVGLQETMALFSQKPAFSTKVGNVLVGVGITLFVILLVMAAIVF